MGKTLIIIGVAIIVIGLIIHFLPKFPLFRLPGDIVIERENFKFYFPIVSGILISIILTLILYLINKIK